ncbi:methyltransferase domain-containing protein [Comamonas flocculans]|uniref:Methyltransferase domain-containing protein n=1 Tax=Comamonas flocculans TaxID=2597701 RepID=A0A5B8RX40_9BURK|nr:methyltransferase domain-containing protein [Comamonas flocculans]QEA13248.1 methyltransferase domain-containing protein [Comamonas flocculans]
MTQTITDLHVYLRSIREGERTSLSVLAGLTPEGATVLDLGCGSGALGQYLRETRRCTVDGLTWSELEAAHARPHYRRVVVANLESCELGATFEAGAYDAIVCADVLEHLSQPERVLAACRALLKPGGQLLISVPNAGYAGLAAELLQGEFRYRDEGLLDRTHLRFFTRRSLTRFLGEQRWQLEQLDTIRRELPDSEFKARFDELPPAVARYLLALPDALSYQFIGAARPVAQPVANDFAAAGAPAQALFTAQLYTAHDRGFAEQDKRSATGVMGQERQTLHFALPAHQSPPTTLRLDPADRPGFLHLYRLRLLDADGEALWQWRSEDGAHALFAHTRLQSIVWQGPLPAASPVLLLLAGDDPWFELPIPAAQLAGATQLEVELGWPMSADYLALSATVQPLLARLGAVEPQLQESLAQTALLREQGASFQQQADQWQRETARLRHELAGLSQHLQAIEDSTIFRATRPLVAAKMHIDRLLGRTPKHLRAAPRPPATPIAPSEHPVDIIVPVYKGLPDTQRCLQSVLASPVHCAWRLIVINDASPEPEVTAWLREAAAEDERITLLENDSNLGFVATVNRGMQLSGDNDVLLLNSDTEVANDWLDRIRAAAHGDARIASVTPLSTNATICSYPRFCRDNALPEGYTTASLDALCARTNPGVVVDVPTGVGFCMYIRRAALNEVGLFDVEHFGKGYGEENDFCQRAAAKGWRNLHLLDTFVLHTGGVSFGDSKSPRERAAIQVLDRLHPRYGRDIHAFVQADPARPYRLALDLARLSEARLPLVLAVLHDRGGGTVRHVRELAHQLAGRAQFLTLTPAVGGRVRLRMADANEGFELAFRVKDQWDDLLAVLRQLGVCHVHYHHLLGHPAQAYDLPALLGVGYDVTAHDYYAFCTHISMTGEDGRFAGEPTPGQCACCTGDMAAPLFKTVGPWRGANARLLTGARQVFAPSRDAARRITGFAPAARVLAVPHTDIAPGTALPTPSPSPLFPPVPPGEGRDEGQRNDHAPLTPPEDPAFLPLPLGEGRGEGQGVRTNAIPDEARPLKIVVIGALSVIKGADLLEATALQAARTQAPLEFHLLGYCYRHLQTQPRARLTVHGEYQDEDLPGLLAWLKPDLVWFPAQWPETYSYTLSAVLQAGLPVAVPDLGAFAERVIARPWSWVLPWDQSPAAWVATFTRLRTEHFASATAPALPAGEPPHYADWHYERDYLGGLAAAECTAQAEQLAAWLPEPDAQSAAKTGLLGALVWLRSLPLLRGVARAVPAHWQGRVKSWLQS